MNQEIGIIKNVEILHTQLNMAIFYAKIIYRIVQGILLKMLPFKAVRHLNLKLGISIIQCRNFYLHYRRLFRQQNIILITMIKISTKKMEQLIHLQLCIFVNEFGIILIFSCQRVKHRNFNLIKIILFDSIFLILKVYCHQMMFQITLSNEIK
ncbi:unnamed protein product [Paramecium pentaurelia]|uniref:Transmembrane protein n=1 Tax=Paramecium pentaurelia TaxID=43138 RepID=A0A8S1VSU8_9CILI|nr:unnamed protein product [Paramecium pentaurelia]